MENIYIKINKSTRQVNLSKYVIGNDGENLQENLVFEFDEFVDGTARLELSKGDTKSYLMLTKEEETYQIPVKSVITKIGRLDMQLVITEGTDDEEIPIFKSNKFYVIVNPSINAEIEEPEEYPEWIDVANTKLNELDNIDIDAEKVEHTATITITQKDGTEKAVEIHDGEQGPQGEQGIQGIQGPAGKDGKDGANGTNGTNGTDGFSPTASVSKSGSVATISITDKNGTTSTTINDGTNGTNGQDGYSPSASVSQSGDTTTISITDKNGTTTASIDISSKLNTSKVKSTYSTTSGDVYDVSYINSTLGDIESLLGGI